MRCGPNEVLSTFQIFFYALRPGFIRYQAPTRWIALNFAVQLSFNALVVKTLGWYSMLYFLLSSHMAGSLHPCAGHFVGFLAFSHRYARD